MPLPSLSLSRVRISSLLVATTRGFHCVPDWRDLYMVFISLFGVVGLALSWIPYFSQPQHRFLRTCTSAPAPKPPLALFLAARPTSSHMRAAFYLVFGWLSLVPVAHLVYMDGSLWFVWRIGRFVLLMGVIYSIAAAFYVSQVPERWAPGKFDYSVPWLPPPPPSLFAVPPWLTLQLLCSARAT